MYVCMYVCMYIYILHIHIHMHMCTYASGSQVLQCLLLWAISSPRGLATYQAFVVLVRDLLHEGGGIGILLWALVLLVWVAVKEFVLRYHEKGMHHISK